MRARRDLRAANFLIFTLTPNLLTPHFGVRVKIQGAALLEGGRLFNFYSDPKL